MTDPLAAFKFRRQARLGRLARVSGGAQSVARPRMEESSAGRDSDSEVRRSDHWHQRRCGRPRRKVVKVHWHRQQAAARQRAAAARRRAAAALQWAAAAARRHRVSDGESRRSVGGARQRGPRYSTPPPGPCLGSEPASLSPPSRSLPMSAAASQQHLHYQVDSDRLQLEIRSVIFLRGFILCGEKATLYQPEHWCVGVGQ